MATWNSRGLRGSTLEEMINYTNEIYRERGVALIQKVPTPIKPVQIDQESRHITLAYFDQKSTVDYIGAVQGIPVCFEAKECAVASFPIANIHEHQIKFMADFEKQSGIAFFLIYYSAEGKCFYVPFRTIKRFFDRAQNGGRKSFHREELDISYQVALEKSVPVHYLEALQKDLDYRDEME